MEKQKWNIDNINQSDYNVNSDPLYIGFSKNSKEGKELCLKFDKALKILYNNGKLNRITKKYIKY
jgi:ABC-type amino acid transport substrate-binding protein